MDNTLEKINKIIDEEMEKYSISKEGVKYSELYGIVGYVALRDLKKRISKEI